MFRTPVGLVGNITRDRELVPTESGRSMVRFSVATEERVRKDDK